jgi:hypothetical protein
MEPNKITPRDFFLWAGAMISLYVSVFSFIWLIFGYIDYTFPNVLVYQPDPYASGMPYQMASLIVLVPTFLVIMRFIRRTIAADPTRYDIWVRRWALFLTVFAAGGSVVIDLIVLLHRFLSGQELTTGFLLKVLVVLLVTGAIFLHFLSDLRGYWRTKPDKAKLVGYGAGLVVIAAIVAGFFIIGTPQDARAMRLDNQRVSDLQGMQWQIVNYWQQKERLPGTLAELQDPISGYLLPRDPETGESYGYRAVGSLSFELCGTFAREGQGTNYYGPRPLAFPEKGISPELDSWQHEAGQECFARTIDPDRYPPYPKN